MARSFVLLALQAFRAGQPASEQARLAPDSLGVHNRSVIFCIKRAVNIIQHCLQVEPSQLVEMLASEQASERADDRKSGRVKSRPVEGAACLRRSLARLVEIK